VAKWLTTYGAGFIWLALWACLLSPQARAEVLLDPTAPLAGMSTGATPDKGAGLPRLQSIILGNGPALAVLNGQSYRVGQLIEGYRLLSISADAVVLEKAGKRQALTLFGSKIRM
jgi:MSHA biogenesis protein MshK